MPGGDARTDNQVHGTVDASLLWRRRTLEQVVLGLSIAALVYLVVQAFHDAPFAGIQRATVVKYAVAVMAIFGGALSVAVGRRVSVDLGATLYLTLLFLLLMVSGSPLGFIAQGDIIWFAVVVLASGLLLRPWATFVTAGLTITVLIWFAASEQLSLDVVLSPAILVAAVAFLAWMYARNLEHSALRLAQIVEKVSQREADLRNLFMINPLAMSLIDPQSALLLDVNEAALRAYGYTRDEMLALHVSDILIPDPNRPPEEHSLSGIWPHTEEQRHRTKDGHTLDLIVSAHAVELGGRTTILTIAQDITERKRAEERLRLMSRVVAESPTSIVIMRHTGEIDYVNPRFEELMGIPAEAIRDQTWDALLQASEGAGSGEEIVSALRSGQTWRGEIRAAGAENTPRWFSLVISSLAATPDSLPFVVATAEDVTARHEAETALRALTSQLEQRVAQRTAELERANIELERGSRLKDEFLAMMSHELRTPLTAILGGAEALAVGNHGELNARQEHLVELVVRNGDHLLNIVNTILDLSRIDAGGITLNVQRIDAAELCTESLRVVQERARQKGIRLGFTSNPVHLDLNADPQRMRQVLVNLLDNAIKFTPEGGKVDLEVAAVPEDETVHLTVRDTGIGIATEQIALLFKPFSQADSRLNRNYDGAGLGLALVSRLTELHGGSIGVCSVVGQGSEFTIVLPLQHWPDSQEEPAASAEREAQPGGSVASALGRRPRILLAEDSPASIEITLAFLDSAEYEVHVVQNGEQAVLAAVEWRPDLILMDIQMPLVDGFEATRRIRALADPVQAGVPIVALTALAMQGDRERCLDAGADDYLSKPFKLSRLIDVMLNQLSAGQEKKAGRGVASTRPQSSPRSEV